MNKILFIFVLLIMAVQFNAEQISNEIYVNSKNLNYDKKTDTINLGKNSLINYQSASIKTDEGLIDLKGKKIYIDGNFYLNYSTDIMKGIFLKADLNFKEGSAKNVNYILNKKIKINAELLNKVSDTLTFYDSFITPCDLKGFFDCPTWSLKVKKTKYNIEDDYFEHFSTFVQVADKKIFYLPYVSHYGSKAPRQKGFLTPTAQITNDNFGANLTTPYYLPINESTDIKVTPTFYLGKNITKYFENNIEYRKKLSEGDMNITFYNYYDRKTVNQIKKGYSFTASTQLNLNNNNNIDANINYTSNISKYKSKNNTKAASLNSTITLNTYNTLKNNDLLISKISGSKALDGTLNTSNPYELPSFKYFNYMNFKNNLILNNEIKIDIISRNTSLDYLPNRIIRASLLNKFQKNIYMNRNFKLINKLIFDNTLISVDEGNKNTNVISGSSNELGTYVSSELNKIYKFSEKIKIKPRAKIIISSITKTKNNNVNDNSQSLSLNYNNIFEENRYFGTDKKEDGSRIALALEQKIRLTNQINLELNYGRIYNFDKKVKILEDINQKSKISDHLTEISFNYKNAQIKYNSRLDEKDFNIKEDVLSYKIENNKNSLILNKSLTSDKAFINSDSSHFMTTEYTRKINKNTNLKYVSEINVGDNNKIYSEEYKIEFFDNCSELNLVYSVDNYNDGKDLKPNKTLSITYELDFLSGFTDEQRMNSIF
tara:strand:- start:286 stop:2430 length:2145 start_codon:yes stop_codon:yes gene_type:complete